MRRIALAAVVALAACQPSESPAPVVEQAAVTAPWLICDGIEAPLLLVFGAQTNGATEVVQYDKPNGALVQRTSYTLKTQRPPTRRCTLRCDWVSAILRAAGCRARG